jgi:hypothetical protein
MNGTPLPGEEGRELEALRYALGELAEPERMAFEARLGEDPALCETLASIVGVVEAVRAGRAVPSVVGYRPRRRLPIRVGLAAGLGLLAVTWYLAAQRPRGVDPAETALAWAGMRGDDAVGLVDLEGEAEAGLEGDDPGDGPLADWMIDLATLDPQAPADPAAAVKEH